MYRLPKDIQKHLQEKFPKITNLKEIVSTIFEEIREKTIDDGSCQIGLFGTFYAYKAYSGRKGNYIPRFKFRISRSFLQTIVDDDYTLQRIEKTAARMYKDHVPIQPPQLSDNPEKLEGMEAIRAYNIRSQNHILNNQRKVRAKTKENLAQDEILKILSEKFDGDEEDDAAESRDSN